MPITILYEDKKYLRLSISSEKLSVIKEQVLIQEYNDVKNLFIDKFLSSNIFNTDKLKECLSEVADKENTENSFNSNKLRENISQEKWSF